MRIFLLSFSFVFLIGIAFLSGRVFEAHMQEVRRSYAIDAAARNAAELEWCKSTLDALSEAPLQDSVVDVQEISI